MSLPPSLPTAFAHPSLSPALLHSSTMFVLMVTLFSSATGLILERDTKIGKSLSAPLTTMALALFLSNVGVMPFSSPVYQMINSVLVPMSIPLLLFDSNMSRIYKETGKLLMAFLVGSFSTVVSTILAFWLVPLSSLGQDSWKIAAALCSRHIGGAINFVAVAETVGITGSAVSSAIAADNLVVAVYFLFLFSLAKSTPVPTASSSTADRHVEVPAVVTYGDEGGSASDQSAAKVAMSLSISAALVCSGKALTSIALPAKTSSLPVISLLTVFLASTMPKVLAPLRETGTMLGVLLIQVGFRWEG